MSPVNEVVRLWGIPRVRLAVAVAAFAVVTAVTYLIAHPRMFTGFAAYDDEGYLLTALKGFVAHGDLYDRIFTQYGPFYYEAWGGLFSLFGIPVDHDSGRTAVMVVWILTGLTIGLATMRITASLLLGLAVQMLVFAALFVFANEPMHPGSLICLMLAAIVAISCFVGDRASPYAMAALGGAVAALVLVKVNIGFFAAAAVALACVVSYPALSRRGWLRLAVESAFVAIPVLLMLGKFDQSWVREYAIHVSVAALAVVIALRARANQRRPAEELGWLVAGFAAVAVVVCLAIVALGTSPGGLLDGVLRQPLRQADSFTLPLRVSMRFYAVDLLALGAAVAYLYASRRREGPPAGAWLATTSLFSIGVGLAIAPSVAGKTFPFDPGSFMGYPLSLLCFCWVALIATPGGDRRPGVAFAGLLLPPLAVLQALHAYPVAGSQILWSSFLMIPVGAICVANGVRGLYAATAAGWRRAVVAGAVAGAVAVMLVIVNVTLRQPLRDDRAAYDALVPLGLPGAESVRVSPAEARLYHEISATIRRECPALVMLPGMDSFYLWTEEEPPSSYNATAWPTLFDRAHQRRVIADTRSIRGLCLLENLPIAEYWGRGAIPSGPLVRYLHRGFRPVASFDNFYRLLKREGGLRARS